MNYWLLTTEYPPLHGGGISTYCYFTARMFSAEGHSVTVFVQDDDVPDYTISVDGPSVDGPVAADREARGITLVRFNSNRNKLHASLGYEARLSYAFADIVRTIIARQGKPDFIEVQDYKGIAYYLTQFKHTGYEFLEGVPLLMTTHSPAFVYLDYNRVPVYRFPDFWTGEMEKQSIVAVDAVQSPSRFLVEEIQKYMDLSGQKVSVQPYPYKELHRAAEPPPYAAEPPGGAAEPPEGAAVPSFTPGKLVFYGKLSRQKGSFELLAYFKDLWDGGFKHPLHIVGATDIVYHPEMQTMGQLVTKQYQSYIKAGLLQFHGKIHPSRMAEYLQDAHVIIVPSIVENFPYVVIETMSMGRVVLASVQGGQREMIEEGVSGFLFDHNDPSSFSRQLLKILSLEDGALKNIGLAATRRIRDAYSFPGIYAQKMRLLEEMKAVPRGKDHFPFLYQEPVENPGLTAAVEGLVAPAPPGGALLSVVIPYYNMGAYIEECLRSVLDSTYKDMEILVIDDGSTEAESIRKLDSIGGWDRVRVVRQPNKGLALTRNEGAALARGTYLAFLDADDKVDPTYYEKAVRALRRNRNVYFAGAWVQYFENSDRMWPAFTPQPPYVLVHNPVNSSGLVYKRAAFLAGGLNDKTVDYGLEDYESVVAMLHHGFNGVVLPEVLFHYRVRTGSMIRGITLQKLVYSNKYIVEKHAAYYAKFAAPVVNLLNANGPGYLFDNPTMEVIVHSRMAKENIFVLKIKSFIKRNEKLKKMALTIKKLKS